MKKITFPILFIIFATNIGYCQAQEMLETKTPDKITVVNDTLVTTTDAKTMVFLQDRDYLLWKVTESDTAYFITPDAAIKYIKTQPIKKENNE